VASSSLLGARGSGLGASTGPWRSSIGRNNPLWALSPMCDKARHHRALVACVGEVLCCQRSACYLSSNRISTYVDISSYAPAFWSKNQPLTVPYPILVLFHYFHAPHPCGARIRYMLLAAENKARTVKFGFFYTLRSDHDCDVSGPKWPVLQSFSSRYKLLPSQSTKRKTGGN